MAYACLHLQYTEESLQRYNNLTAAWLPEDSPHVKSQKAMVYYNARGEGTRIAGVVCVCVDQDACACSDFEEAGRLYGEVFERDPERIDEADFYSNVLFVMVCNNTVSLHTNWMSECLDSVTHILTVYN